ncbi:MAG: carboxypeptidase regulatory-like domain-containing protein [Bryobacteraceae bacterium]
MKAVLTALFLFLMLSISLDAQIITGSVAGTVVDPSGSRVPDATLTLVYLRDQRELRTSSSGTGDFVFSGLESGEYNLTVAKTGFKTLEQKSLVVITGQRLALGNLTLQVGGVSEVVSVTAERGMVQTQSSERAGTVTGTQLEGLLTGSRSVPSLVYLLPGVVAAGDGQYLTRQTRFNAVGGRTDTNTVMVDGILSTDIDDGGNLKLQVSQDAVAEVQVLLTNYQAEHGRMGGAVVQQVTKSGTPQFHGLGSYYMRREWMNAMGFFNNRNSEAKPRYRYNTITGNIGGPVLLPGGFNRNRDKLFFFFSMEYWPVKNPITQRVTMPTDLEKSGDFSQSVDLANKLIVIKDPFNNAAPFAGNVIPLNRIDKSGQALLKIFPQPNFLNRAVSGGNYNYTATGITDNPNRTETIKIDYYINANNSLVGSYNGFRELEKGAAGGYWLGNWQQMPVKFYAPNKGASLRYTRIISATMVNEAQFSWFANPEKTTAVTDADWQKQLRKNAGFNVGMISPKANLEGVLPAATFGGVTGAASLRISGRIPVDSPYNFYTWNDKFTYIRAKHTFKAGVTIERYFRDIEPESTQYGSFSFSGTNVNNPLNTGYAYANAILGVFDSYVEDSQKSWQRSRGGTINFFVQDTWKATSRLTFDVGMRFYYFTPHHTKDNKIAGFVPSYYKAANQVRLIRPYINAEGKRVGIDPITGTLFPNAAIAAIVPGVGDPANGMVAVDQHPEYPRGMFNNRGIQYGPRFGFAYDPFGKNKTAIRGGFGVFYNPLTTNKWRNLSTQPPQIWQPNVYFGQLSTLTSVQSLITPITAVYVDPDGYIPTVMNFSFGIQQNVGFGAVLDVSYVGSLGRHLAWQRDINYIAMGARFLPSNIDPTTNRVLDDKFLRPLAGFNNINRMENAGTSNYNSLQVTLNRRFTRGLQIGGAWTWSKAMTYVDSDTTNIAVLVPIRIWNYGMAGFDRTHVVKINYVWDLPRTPWQNPVARTILNGWQLSGISTFQSGAPGGIAATSSVGVDITGTPSQSFRADITGNPVLPKSQRTFARNFDTSVVRMPAVGTVGNSARTVLRQPGINNWDAELFKNIPIHESVRLQFRWGAYNLFNHTQFSAFNTAAQFNASNVQINSQLGQYTSAAANRRLELAVRLYY